MVWALSNDDHNGKSCGEGSYPLLKTIANCLMNGNSGGNQKAPAATMAPTPKPTPRPTRARTTPVKVVDWVREKVTRWQPVTQERTTQRPVNSNNKCVYGKSLEIIQYVVLRLCQFYISGNIYYTL